MLPLIGYSQTTDSVDTEAVIYNVVEILPEFPGGLKKMMSFLSFQR